MAGAKATLAVIEELATRAKSGLDELAMDFTSRMARAKDMGFNVDDTLYHGTISDVGSFDTSKAGSRGQDFGDMVFLSDSPDVASGYSVDQGGQKEILDAVDKATEVRRSWGDSVVKSGVDSPQSKQAREAANKAQDAVSKAASNAENYITVSEGANVIPAKIRGNMLDYDADGALWRNANKNAIEQAKIGGYDGVRMHNVVDAATTSTQKPSTVTAVFDPSNIRSVNAAFDPSKSSSSNLLASGLAGTAVAGGLATQSQEAEAGVITKGVKKVSSNNNFLFDIDPNKLNATEFDLKDISNYKGDPSKPISVTMKDGNYEILDGHHRAKIAKESGENVRAVVIPNDDVLIMNEKGIHQGDMLSEWIATDGPKRAGKAVGAGLATAGALYTPEQNKAYANKLLDIGRPDLIPSNDTITADEAPILDHAADFINRWTQTPVGSPLEGLAEYLKGFGKDDGTQAKATRAFWAAMDVMP